MTMKGEVYMTENQLRELLTNFKSEVIKDIRSKQLKSIRNPKYRKSRLINLNDYLTNTQNNNNLKHFKRSD